MRALCEKAGGIDGMFRWVNRSGHRVLERTSPAGKQLVVPPEGGLRRLLLEEIHAAGHFGSKRTQALLAQRVFWPNMASDVTQYVRECEVCAKQKDSTQLPGGLLEPLEIPTSRFDTWTIDFVTDLPVSNGCNAFLTCVEKLTKYVVVAPCTLGEGTMSATATADLFFEAVVSRFGVPKSLVSDRDPRFTAQFWQQLWSRLGTRLRLASAYHPQTDGQTERAHRTLE